MASLVPLNEDGYGLSSRQASKAARAQQQAELEVFRHGLAAAVVSAFDRQDSQALGDACQAALDEEMSLLDYGLHRADGSAAKVELVARKVQMQAAINDRRISRRFGR